MTTFTPKFEAGFRYWELAVAASKAATSEARQQIWSHWIGPDPIMHPAAQRGYWKMRVGRLEERKWVPVAIQPSTDGRGILVLFPSQGGHDRRYDSDQEEDLLKIWQRCGRDPISYETYAHAVQTGSFPGEIAATAPRLDNYADDPGSKFRDEMIELAGKTELYLRNLGEPLSEEAANALANYLDTLREASSKAEEILKKEVEEQKAEIARRKELWAAPTSTVTDLIGRIRKLLTPYLSGRKAAGDVTPRIGGQTGRRVGLGAVWRARVLDWDKVMVEFHNDPKVRELIQTLLDARARSKDRVDLGIDGTEFYQEEIVR